MKSVIKIDNKRYQFLCTKEGRFSDEDLFHTPVSQVLKVPPHVL